MADPRGKSTKSPAFQFYPESWFSSSKVQRMSHTERGIYIDLLGYCWLENGLPNDTTTLAQMVKLPSARFARIWSGPLHECFFERGGKLFNVRQERERKKQADFRKGKQDAAHMRWMSNAHAQHMQKSANGNADAMPSVSSSISVSSSTSKKEQKTSAEPHGGSTPFLAFVVVGEPPSWMLSSEQVVKWQEAYPSLDVAGECQRARAWLDANPTRRKTHKGMAGFLVNWMNRTVDRGGRTMHLAATGTEGRGRTGAPPKGKYDGIAISDETEGL